jgi:hypothetical protein
MLRWRTRAVALALGLGTFVGSASTSEAQLYYGGDPGSGGSFASWINNPANTLNQIVFDNFLVGGGGWTISSVFGNLVAFDVVPMVTTLSWEIRTGMSVGNVGSVVAAGGGGFAVNGSRHTIATAPIFLAPGTYWLSIFADLNGNGGTDPFIGPQATQGLNSVNAVLDNQAVWLVGADAFNFGGSANPISHDFGYGVDGQAIGVVPEPGTFVLIGTGLAGLVLARRRRRQVAA